mmetsp:Transcript_16907/g.38951  ORF Transcript_16907/g.38951 Transcript_16907/m.38951 type:complete len:87 (-) Transcript_16907:59-319(-)
MIMHDLSVARPHQLDSLWSSDASSSWVASRAKPVVLWSASSASTDTCVCSPVHSAAQNLVLELHVLADYSSSEVGVAALERLQHEI